MAAIELLDYEDIYTAVLEEIGESTSNTVALNKVKRAINFIYLNEVVPRKDWLWLRKRTNVIHKAAVDDGTANLTPNDTAVTLSVAPDASLGSLAGYKFTANGFDEIYEISAHTAGSASLTLSSAYQGTANTESGYIIWRDRIDLPTDCLRTFQVDHDRYHARMKGVGYQELQKIQAESRKAEGFPSYYHTSDFEDPSSGTAETESDRYRQTILHPSIHLTENVTIKVDYIQEVTALDAAADEPLMPIGDRVVLFYGAVSYAWRVIARNPEEAERRDQDFKQKLAFMSGELEDGYDAPSIAPKSRYIQRQRASRIGGRRLDDFFTSGATGGSGNNNITFLQNVTIKGATITDTMTFSSGVSACFDGLTATAVTFLDSNKCITNDANLTYDSATSTLNVSNVAVNSNIDIDGELRLNDSDASNYVGLKAAGTVAGDVVWTLPDADGSSGQVLRTDGSGILSWISVTTDTVSSTGNVDFNFVDEDTDDNDNGVVLRANATDTGSGSEDVDFSILVQEGGSLVEKIKIDADGDIELNDDVALSSGSQIFADPGTNALPGISFNGDSDTGIYRPYSNGIRFVCGTSIILTLEPQVFQVTRPIYQSYGSGATTPPYTFSTDTNTGMSNPNADEVAFRAGGTDRVFVATDEMRLDVPITLHDLANSSLPSAGTAGRAVYNTDTTSISMDDGTQYRSIMETPHEVWASQVFS